ncbi:hypothetical protein CR513_34877, partial [Mucuna pruriens]
MVTIKGFTKRSTFEGKPFTMSSHGEYCTYCKRLGHTKNTCYKFYGKEKENIVEHPSTLQLDQDIQAFIKKEMDRLRTLLNSISKPLSLCGLTIKKRFHKATRSLILGQPQKLGQLLKFDFTINILDIHHLGYLRQCFHIYLQKSLSSLLSVMFVNFQSTIVQHFLLVIIIKVLNLLTLFILMCGCQLVTLYRGLSGLYRLLMIVLVYQIFIDFFYFIKNQFDKSIKRLQSDNDTKFVNLEFFKFPKDNGVVHELTCVNTPQQNGVAKTKNHHLLEVAKALLFQMFGEIALTTTYLINRLPTRVLNGISSIKHMLSFFPSPHLMLSLPCRVFGCVTFVHSHNPHCGKLEPRAVKHVFIGYPSIKKRFKCYHFSSRRVFISIDVTFHETCHSLLVLHFRGRDVYLFMKHVILVSEQVQLFELDVSILENPIEDSFIIAIDAIKTPTFVQEALKDEN